MSKIAEQKALEAYPEIEGSETYFDRDYICTKPIDLNRQRREGYVKGYDQAMQDFLVKASKYLFDNLPHTWDITQTVSFIDNFKNYMQDEK